MQEQLAALRCGGDVVDRFLNAIARRSAAMDAGTGQPRFGLVTSYDPNTYTAKVTLQPEGVQTGWLPILTQWMGADWGMVAPLSPGDQVFVLPQEGNAEHGVIVGRCYSDQDLPPKTAADGEFWLVHKSGSFLKFMADGTIQAKGDLHVDGKVIATGEVVAMDGANAVHLSTHTTPNITRGSATSDAPTPGS
jgi:phage baseplate assembly protein gpV